MNRIILFLTLMFFKADPTFAAETDNISRNQLICEDNWTKFEDFCYMLEGDSYDSFLTWTGASSRCTELGAKLVSILSQDENDFITNTFVKNTEQLVWIGLHAEGSTLEYMWEDGSPLTFTNWAPFEPIAVRGRSINTVAIHGIDNILGSVGEWVDWISIDYLPFICKKAASPSDNKTAVEPTAEASSTTLRTTQGNLNGDKEYVRDVQNHTASEYNKESKSNQGKHSYLITAAPYLSGLVLIGLIIVIAYLSMKWMKRKEEQATAYNKLRDSALGSEVREHDDI